MAEKRKNDEIPGFYKDPKTGKYFREKPGGTSNLSLKKIKAESQLETVQSATPSRNRTNVLKYLSMREITPISGTFAQSEFCKIKAEHKEELQHVALGESRFQIASVDFVKGCEKSVFGFWISKNEDYNKYVIGEQNFLNLPDYRCLRLMFSDKYIIDMCDGPEENIICLHNSTFLEPYSIEYYNRRRPEIYGVGTVYRNGNLLDTPPLFCCCSTNRGLKHALGGVNCISCYNGFTFDSQIDIDGGVHTLCCDKAGKIMCAGLHDGRVFMIDNENYRITKRIQISDSCFKDSCFLDPWYFFISGVNGGLVGFDIRMNAVVFEFRGHVQSTRKRPFSIANDMLCATGADNVLRIWHLSGGYPIHEMKPIINYHSKIRGVLNSDGDKVYLNYFEDDIKKVFQII